jgi:hypothetical protein
MKDGSKYRIAFMTRQRLLLMGLKQVLAAEDSEAQLCDLPTVTDVGRWIQSAAAAAPHVVGWMSERSPSRPRRSSGLPHAYVPIWL